MTPHDLAAWAEKASPEEQRAVLEEAWPVLHPEPSAVLSGDMDTMHASVIARAEWRGLRARFTTMLDAEAWESAALMLVPDGWSWRMVEDLDLPGRASIVKNSGLYFAEATTPALALCAAILRAKETNNDA